MNRVQSSGFRVIHGPVLEENPVGYRCHAALLQPNLKALKSHGQLEVLITGSTRELTSSFLSTDFIF